MFRSNYLILSIIIVFIAAGSGAAAWIPLSLPGQIDREASLKIVESDGSSTLLELSIPGLEISEKTGVDPDDKFEFISIPGCGTSIKAGAPCLPVFTTFVCLPSNGAPDIEIVSSEYTTFSDMRIYPKSVPVFEGEEPEFYLDSEIYARDGFQPGDLASADAPEVLRNLVISRLTIKPVQYNPVSRETRIFTKLLLRVTEAGNPPAGLRILHAMSPQFKRICSEMICNYEYLDIPEEPLDQDDTKFLVITKPAYYDEIAPLVEWRRRMGYPVEVASVDDIGGTTFLIKSYIADLYFSDGLEYVLLVGDIDEIPCKYWSDTYSDSWYSCVDPGGDGDYLADLAIGRLTFNSNAELIHQITKILSYLTNPSVEDNWAEKNILVAHSESYPGKYTQCSEEIRTYNYAIQNPIFDTAYGGAGAGNSDVIAAINEGRGIVNYRGHGSATSWSSWGSEGSFTVNHIRQCTNSGKLFVGFGICCSNMKLDTGGDCLAESFLKEDNAAIAYLSAWEPSYTEPNHVFDKSLFKAIYDVGVTTIGYVENLANIDVHAYGSYGDANIRTYLWLGDPATDIWTLQPSPFSVGFPGAIAPMEQEITVTVSLNGNPMQGAMVCLAVEGEFSVYGYTDTSGAAILTVEPTHPCEMNLTVTGHNGLPFEDVIQVISPDYPWLVLAETGLDDTSSGNGNGLADYGETITLHTGLLNLGYVTAYGVTGSADTEDPQITLETTTDVYGEIAYEDTVQGAGGYTVTVDADCDDGHVSTVNFLFTDDQDSSWTGSLDIKLHAPLLEAGGFRIDDSAYGDDNGNLDPGETADLYLTVDNLGSGAAESLFGVVSTIDEYVTIQNNYSEFPDIPGFNSGESTQPYVVEVDPGCPEGHVVIFQVHMETAAGYSADSESKVYIGGFSDDMESGEGEWTHYPVEAGFNDEWHLSDRKNHTPGGGFSWKCGDTGGGNYGKDDDAALVTPALYLGSNSMLEIWHWLDAEVYHEEEACDGGIVEISDNDGITWEQITPVTGYPYVIKSNSTGPFEDGTPCYSGFTGWRKEIFDLAAWSGEIQVRFRFGSDHTGGETGWFIDDMRITTEGPLSMKVMTAPQEARRGMLVFWEIWVRNNGGTEVVDYWLTAEMEGPLSIDVPIGAGITIPGGYDGVTRLSRRVNPTAPLGWYTIDNKLGSFPDSAEASDSFRMEIIP